MDTIKLAAEVIQQTEAKLRDIVAKAATAGDYDSVVRIASWASTLRAMINKEPTSPAVNITPTRTSAGKTRHDYPQFLRHGEQLVRVAWSKRERKEYFHKTSHAVLRIVAAAIAEAGKQGRVFSTDDFLPLQGPDGSSIPSYQTYVCLALFKQSGLIDQHGRQGYSIVRPADFREAAEAAWNKLPSK